MMHARIEAVVGTQQGAHPGGPVAIQAQWKHNVHPFSEQTRINKKNYQNVT